MDTAFMQRAIELAKLGIGHVSPNPLVGCVITKDGAVIGEGAHLVFGGPHAEPNAIQDAESHGHSVEGATVYVTLEPHSHRGKTAPCSQLLISKRIARCVVAMQDPYPEVDGRGIKELRNAGIEVEVGVLEQEARELNRFFIKHVTAGLPYVTLKIAQSLDGRSALANGQSRWITGEQSLRRVHQERAIHDAVLVGASTARIDDPSLTVRHVEGRQPWRVVLDTRLELPSNLKIFQDEHRTRTIVATTSDDQEKLQRMEELGVTIIRVDGKGRIVLPVLMQQLAQMGIASVLVEAGPTLAASILSAALVDELQIFVAPIALGGDALPSIGALHLQALAEARRLHLHAAERIGNDMLLRLRY